MKRILLLLVPIVISCNNLSPISGVYETKDKYLSATILDSTLYLMFSVDSAIIYDLRIHSQFALNDSTTIRLYNVLYNNCLSDLGYGQFEIPYNFEYSSNYGGTLMAIFENNDSFLLGGFTFYKPLPSDVQRIFNNWKNLFANNLQTRLLIDEQDN